MSASNAHFSYDEAASLAERLGVAGEVDLEQLRIGMEVELEHGRRDPVTNVTDDDPLLTAKIALAHLRELPDYYTRLARMEAAVEGRELRVRDLMTVEPLTVRDNTPLTVAHRLMREQGVSGLPVVNADGALVGVLSRTDVMAAAGGPQSAAWQGVSVASTMTSPGLTVGADALLAEAAARMEQHHVHRLVVVEPDSGHPIGLCKFRCGRKVRRTVARNGARPQPATHELVDHGQANWPEAHHDVKIRVEGTY